MVRKCCVFPISGLKSRQGEVKEGKEGRGARRVHIAARQPADGQPTEIEPLFTGLYGTRSASPGASRIPLSSGRSVGHPGRAKCACEFACTCDCWRAIANRRLGQTHLLHRAMVLVGVAVGLFRILMHNRLLGHLLGLLLPCRHGLFAHQRFRLVVSAWLLLHRQGLLE